MTTRPNAKRTAKMRTLTLTDNAWAVLTRLAKTIGSRSAVVEGWCESVGDIEVRLLEQRDMDIDLSK